MDAVILDKAVEYTKQFINAATPVVKQAYEIGLVTLQIDAIQALVYCFIGLFIAIGLLIFIIKAIKKASALALLANKDGGKRKNQYCADDYSDYLAGDGVPHVLSGLISLIIGLSGLINVLNVWLWVKLFQPDLWLAHMAIQKIIN